ncbi:putative enoyl-CoA hydratase, mitochondrial [Symbiodinium microadriaticum]|uniref:Putative enoyl-CoA hydratase, mitochondrial n=1 Tax=Symbiodinium microadriaticum TaxID=2951 RepID=A0A1Q9CM34_SYMMI|nr:putative enoyl-CoA hydratase, mitochondrial [Symbiodinium microadriaticum]
MRCGHRKGAVRNRAVVLRRLQQLTVALIQGTAMGAGIGLVCACDYVISVKSAFFTMSETKLGAVPATALPYITRRCTFIKNVYQLVLAGANLSSEIAEEYGFVDKVVDEVKDLETECQAVCDRMTLCAPGAVAATKDVVMNTVGVPPSSFMMNYVAGIVADIRAGPECKAGMQAVLNKTRPKWADTPIALRGPAEAQQLAWRSAMVSLLPPGNPFVAGRVFDFGQVQGTPRAAPAGQVRHVSLPYAPRGAPTYPQFAQPVHVVAPQTIPPGTVYSPVVTHRPVYAAATPSLHSHVVSPMSSPMLGYRPVAETGMPRVLEGIGTPGGFTRLRSLSQDRVRVDVLERTSSPKAMKTEERSVPTAISPTSTRSLEDAQPSGARSGTPTRLARSASKELRIMEDDWKIADSPKLERRERVVPQPISPQSSRASMGMRSARSASWRASTPESSPKSSMRIPSKGRHDSYQKSLQAHGPWDNRNAPGNDFNSSLRDRVLPLNSGRSRPLSRSLSRSSSREFGLGEDEAETHAGHRLSRAHTASFRLKCSDRPDRSASPSGRRSLSRGARSNRSRSASPSRAAQGLNWFPLFKLQRMGTDPRQ